MASNDVLSLIGLRLYWSLRKPWPSAAPPSRLQWLVRAVHGLLLLMLMIMPVSGFLSSAFSGYGAHIFGVMIVPEIVDAAGATQAYNSVVYESAKLIHRVLAYVFSGFIILHIAAALKHHFIDRDETLRKMMETK
jgi:cytochrome b561